MSRRNYLAGSSLLSSAALLAGGFVIVLATAATADAQSTTTTSVRTTRNGPQLEQVVVTAQRKKQTLQEAPVAVTFISPQTTKNLDIRSIHDMGLITPSVSFSAQVDYAQVFIRGIGTNYANPGLEIPVSIYTDGVYSTAAYGSLFSTLDSAGVVVLNGPQGTLWGRNASGGVILVNSADPTNKQGGSISTEAGMYGHVQTDVVYNTPITPDLRFRIAGRFTHDDGYVHNEYDGHTLGGGTGEQIRAKLDWTPSAAPGLDVLASVDYSYMKEHHDMQQELLQAPLCLTCTIVPNTHPPHGFYDTNQDGGGAFIQRNLFAYVKINYVNGPITYTSLSGYRTADFGAPQGSDQDYTTANYFQFHSFSPGRTYTEDLQMATNYSGPLNVIAGLSYMNDRRSFISAFYGDAFAGLAGLFPGSVPVNHSNVLTKSVSGFVQATYQFDKQWALQVGGRYNVDHRDLSAQNNPEAAFVFQPGEYPIGTPGSIAQKATFYSFTPTGTLTYKAPVIGDAYIKFEEGFKAGGFSTPSFARVGVISPEKNKSEEIGLKSRFMDGRLTTTIDGFHYDDKNLQVQITDVNAGGSVTKNAGSSEGYGIEFGSRFAATEDLILGVGGDWLHANFTNFTHAAEACLTGTIPALADCNTLPNTDQYTTLTGHVLPHAPKFTGYLTAEYSFPVMKGYTASLAGALHYTTGFDFISGAGGQLGLDHQKGYALLNINGWVTPADGKYRVGFYLDNATFTKYNDFLTTGQPYGAYHQAAPPIAFGVKLQYNFGNL